MCIDTSVLDTRALWLTWYRKVCVCVCDCLCVGVSDAWHKEKSQFVQVKSERKTAGQLDKQAERQEAEGEWARARLPLVVVVP